MIPRTFTLILGVMLSISALSQEAMYQDNINDVEDTTAYVNGFNEIDFGRSFSLAIGNGINYGGGNVFGIAVAKRFGGVMGIEPNISLGVNGLVKETKGPKLTYSAGLNLFVYRGIYLGAAYGVNDYKLDNEFVDSDGELHYKNGAEILNYHGLSFLAGWKCYFWFHNGKFYFDVAVGCGTHANNPEKLIGFDVTNIAWNMGFGFVLN